MPFSSVGKAIPVFGSPAMAQIRSCATVAFGPIEGAGDLSRVRGKIGRTAPSRRTLAGRGVVPRELRAEIARVAETCACKHARVVRHHRWHIDGIDGSEFHRGWHAIYVAPVAARAGKIAILRIRPNQQNSWQTFRSLVLTIRGARGNENRVAFRSANGFVGFGDLSRERKATNDPTIQQIAGAVGGPRPRQFRFEACSMDMAAHRQCVTRGILRREGFRFEGRGVLFEGRGFDAIAPTEEKASLRGCAGHCLDADPDADISITLHSKGSAASRSTR